MPSGSLVTDDCSVCGPVAGQIAILLGVEAQSSCPDLLPRPAVVGLPYLAQPCGDTTRKV